MNIPVERLDNKYRSKILQLSVATTLFPKLKVLIEDSLCGRTQQMF